MLRRATTLGYRSGFNIDEQLRAAFDVVTASGAKALRLEGYGLRIGAKADFVALNAEHVPEAVVAVPQGRSVYKDGRLVAANGRMVGKSG
jgi:cytosine deaminase